jgi:hypothetical protein
MSKDDRDISLRLSWICQCRACQTIERQLLEQRSKRLVALDIAEADEFYAQLKAELDERAPA